MPYSLACADVIAGCPATFTADSEAALLAQIGPHALADHGLAEITPEVLAVVKGAITRT